MHRRNERGSREKSDIESVGSRNGAMPLSVISLVFPSLYLFFLKTAING